jgi:hypothetical protein
MAMAHCEIAIVESINVEQAVHILNPQVNTPPAKAGGVFTFSCPNHMQKY